MALGLLGSVAAAQTLDVRVDQGLLSVDLDAVALSEVLQEIAEQTGAELVIRGELGEVRPQAFRDEPVARGVRRLVGRNGIIMKFEPGATDRTPPRLTRLMVYAADTVAGDPTAVRSIRTAGGQPVSYGDIAGLDLRARLRAVRDLARSDEAGALATLGEILASDEDPQVRRAAVANLARADDPDALLLVQDALADADPMVRVEAVRALGARRDESAAGPLAQVLGDDPDPTVRRVAVQVLASLDSEEARAILEIALDDADDAVRAAAANALER